MTDWPTTLKLPLTKDDTGSSIELPYKLNRRALWYTIVGHSMLMIFVAIFIMQIFQVIDGSFVGDFWAVPILFMFFGTIIVFTWFSHAIVTRIRIDEHTLTVTQRFGYFYRINRVYKKDESFKIDGSNDHRPLVVKWILKESNEPNRYLLKIQKTLFNNYSMVCEQDIGEKIVKTLNKWKKS